MNDPAASSKDRFFERLAEISNQMSEAHGRDFAIGALVLAARYIVENSTSAEAPGNRASAGVARPDECAARAALE